MVVWIAHSGGGIFSWRVVARRSISSKPLAGRWIRTTIADRCTEADCASMHALKSVTINENPTPPPRPCAQVAECHRNLDRFWVGVNHCRSMSAPVSV